MKIECENNPDDLISLIGNRFFMIVNEEDLSQREKSTGSVFIIDCENGVKIEVSSDYGKDETYETAEALLKLLNQEYTKIHEN